MCKKCDQELEIIPSKELESPSNEICTWQLVQMEQELQPKGSKSSLDEITWQLVQFEPDTLNFLESGDLINKSVRKIAAEDTDSQFFSHLFPYFKSLNVVSKIRCGIEIQVVVLKYLCNEKSPHY